MQIKFPLGYDDFARIREDNFYYVDKTDFIRELLNKTFQANLIMRPRRFGKTLTMSMLEDFLDISRDSRAHFEGLKISEETELCEAWQNQWPVIFLTLKDVSGECFEEAYAQIAALISDFCITNSFLAESEKINIIDRKLAYRFMAKETSKEEIKNSIYTLTRMLSTYYGKSVILLIDEYDVPLAKANENNYYKEMLELVRAMISKALKTNPYLKLAVVTGCLRISKESIFTGMNHFVPDSILDDRFDEYIGFTESDVQELLAATDFSDRAETIREWYDGYHFGNVDVYCPWDVLNYLNDLQKNPEARPKAYWANTSGNSILKTFFQKSGRAAKAEIERLIAGECVRKRITDQLTYDVLDKTIDNLWSLLYLTGYLTLETVRTDGTVELVIPNQEIREIFIAQISEWFTASVVGGQQEKWNAFCNALEIGDAAVAEKLLTAFLANGISIRDTYTSKSKKENFYHGVLLGLLMSRDNWIVYSNHEDGDGYSDIHVEVNDDIAFVIEMKYAENDALDAGCKAAMEQIAEKRYADDLIEQGFSKVYAYGVACYKKHCKIVCGTLHDNSGEERF